MSASKPRLFIGSSTESLSIARAVKRGLDPVADVTLWDDPDEYQKPNRFLLDSLLEAAGVYDFAVMVLAPDDLLVLRDKPEAAPRDNVVFELGLFLSQLGLERTFWLMQRKKREKTRILSDLQNLRPFEFTLKRGVSMDSSVADACATMSERIRELGTRDVDLGPRDVSDVGAHVSGLIRQARSRGRPLAVCNIALDMEKTWPLLRDQLLADDAIEDVTWQSLMVDSTSPLLESYWSTTVSQTMAAHAEASIRQFCEQHADKLRRRRIRFECRAYPTPPVIHGFLFWEDRALMSMCSIVDGKLVGGPNPYKSLQRGIGQPRSAVTDHLISAFEGWFRHLWTTGSRPVWPVPEAP